MKTVSTAYRNSMNSAFRSQSEVRISLERTHDIAVFGSDIITSVAQTTDIDPVSRKLPTETLSFSIIDIDGAYNPNAPSSEWEDIDANATVTVQFGYRVSGSVEWLERDEYILTGRPSYENGVANFQATKRLATLTNTYYKGVFPSNAMTYFAMAEMVLKDAGVPESKYVLDEYLSYYPVSAPMPIDTHRNCLQMIAHACGCALYTDSLGRITIKHLNLATMKPLAFQITRRDIVKDSEAISKIEPVYKTEAYRYGYSEFEENSKEIYKDTLTLDNVTDFHIEFNTSKDVVVSVNGVTVSADIYARAARVELQPGVETTISATGYPVKTSSNLYTRYITSDVNAGIDTSDNPIVTNYDVCAILAENMALYLKYRTNIELAYRGNPELQALDCISYYTQFGTITQCLVLKSVINYNGALSGQLILKILSEEAARNLLDVTGDIVYESNGEAITTSETKDIRADYLTAQIDEFIVEVVD